jgi:Asp-tRNA(Asn)/Glu-tRNA(Gln) amidotransferase A subunit family amidase
MTAADAGSAVAADLARITELDPVVTAFEEVFTEAAMPASRGLDAGSVDTEDAGTGRPSRGAGRGPLHGFTVGIKDIFELAGRAPGNGNRAAFDMVHRATPQVDAPVVQALRTAGAVVAGMTKSTELCWYHPTTTRNPHDLACTPGGSSSGSAAAVAAGMVRAALGSQTNGSTVRPASYCGVYGFKPSHGRVDITGMTRISLSFDHPGFFARDAQTLTAVTATAGGFHVPTGTSPLVAGVVDLTGFDDVDAEVRTVVDDYVGLLRDAGHTVVPMELPELLAAETFEAFSGVFAPELFGLHRDLLSPRIAARLGAETLDVLRRGDDTSDSRRRAAERACTDLRARVDERFGDCDVLVLPAATSSAPRGLTSTGSPAMSTLSSLTGVPVAAIPAGLGVSGRPVGVQVWGRLGADEFLLAALPHLPSRTVTPDLGRAGR